MPLSVCKIKSTRCLLGRKTSLCAVVKNLFIDVANVVCTGQKAYAPITLKIMYRCFFAKNMYNFRCITQTNYHGTKYQT